ncbi:MAG: recombinase family protein [Dorea sp.]|nr:recombinase family protein [Dorea sp.]
MIESIYRAAVYLRLSRDDKDIDGSMKSESDSISSQRELIHSYIKEHGEMELYATYVDDGRSGADFDRPGFKQMMNDIEAGNVNCVIVKDLSRLGRDYIEAGRLIQKIFPAFHVRFIAVTDRFDSQTADNNMRNLILPVKNFINDSYCRDISRKVKSHQETKRKQGQFIGAFAAYGYRKSSGNRNKLCPDDYSADIVRKIFAWKQEGMSTQAIAQTLNELGVLSPMEYKKSHGEKFSTGFRTNVKAKWSAVAVKRILTNEIYTGVMEQGKSEKINYKVKKILSKPKEEWIRVEGTHEPIISLEDFEIVQNLLRVDTRAKTDSACSHLFSGLLFCGDCKEPMIRRINRYKDTSKVYFICATKNKGQGCSRHSILEDDLTRIVFRIIQVYTSIFFDVCAQLEYIRSIEVNFEEITRFDKEMENLHRERDKYLKLRDGLYEDRRAGLITEEDFKNFYAIYERQYEETKKAAEKQKKMIKQLFRSGIASAARLEKFKETMKLTVLERNELLCFVNRIVVYEGERIYVEFRGREEFHSRPVRDEDCVKNKNLKK